MDLNKELITRVILGIFLSYIFIKMSQYLLSAFKKKLPGYQSAENDIDQMIKRQESKIRNQYGITPPSNAYDKKIVDSTTPKELEAVFKEASWGGGELVNKIKRTVTQNYAYTLGDSKINAFILLAKSRNYFQYLSHDNIQDQENLTNFLSTALFFHLLIDEIKTAEATLVEMFARKIQIAPLKLQLALQIKILNYAKINPPLKEDRKFTSKIILNSLSEETLHGSFLTIIKREANLWAKDPALFSQELATCLVFSEIIYPLPVLKNKLDLETALAILQVEEGANEEEIKKAFKKKALFYHPDKIGQMKLSPYLVTVAKKKFNTIKEAYDMLASKRS